ncbi:MAG: hypothetical protein ACXWF0_07235 [Usitatibacter sp.]
MHRLVALLLLAVSSLALPAEPALDYSDMWWAGPAENGWGMSVTQHGSLQFIALYVYDGTGKPAWYVLPNGTWNASLTAYSGALYRPTSSPYTAYDPSRFNANDSVGTLTVTYASASTATLAYAIEGVSGTKSVSRQSFGAGAKLSMQVGDLWWDPAENGWGMNIAQQGPTLFPVWYTYDANGRTTWFVVPGGSWSGASFTGDIFATTGSAWLGATYDPAALAVRRAGTMTLAFNGASRATMTYTVDGLTQQKSIERQFPDATPAPMDIELTGMAVVKVRADALGMTTMEEKLNSIFEIGPNRRITTFDSAGAVGGRYTAPEGSSIVDFARHPSGETTVVLATAKTVTLVRLGRSAAPIDEFPLTDPQAPGDPFYDSGGIHDDTSMVPIYTRDAARLAPIGENLAVALRTGRNAVVAYRFDRMGAGYTRTWRTLVEPGLSIFADGIFVGSFDVFGALENHWHVLLDADAAGNVAVAVVDRPNFVDIFAAHANFFSQPIAATAGLLVTRLAPDGRRLGTTPIDTVRQAEAHGLRLNGDDVAVVGRVFTEQRGDGGGWNAYAAHVSRASGALSSYRPVDVSLGEILFDIAPLPNGRFLAAGAAGYTQNPTGGSISEQMTPLPAVLESDGTVRQLIDLPSGPRENQLRSLATRGNDWLIGGLVNGPGTHSGDGNPGAISADGFVREVGLTIP